MSVKKCEDCGVEYAETANYCSRCGERLLPDAPLALAALDFLLSRNGFDMWWSGVLGEDQAELLEGLEVAIKKVVK